MEIKEVSAATILNPTSIDLGDFVINPYRGCEFSCLYCYARFNKAALKDTRKWGNYIDVRINAPELLEKELLAKKPSKVLIGSTTECFQPAETKYRVTQKILELLNKHKIYYSILSRSALACEYIPLLNKGFCNVIYFTLNNYNDNLKNLLEPKSPQFAARINAVEKLSASGINVIPYFSPILPFISKPEDIFSTFKNIKRIDFEGLNFNLGNIQQVINAVSILHPEIEEKFLKMLNDVNFYNETWEKIKTEIKEKALLNNMQYEIFIHGFKSYFENQYIKK